MNHWLFKSEPDAWSWDPQVARGAAGEEWHGVRNYQARNNMRAMQLGDRGFFYHSNIGKEVVGIAEVIALAEDIKGRCTALRDGADLPEATDPAQVDALLAELTHLWERRNR